MNSVVAVDASKVLEDNWLNTSFGAGDVVTHGVETGLGWVDFDDVLESGFTSVQSVVVVLAHRFALLQKKWLGVLSVFDHLSDVDLRVKMWLKSRFRNGPTWGKPSSNSSSHL